MGKTVAELCSILTNEELLGWLAYAELDAEDFRKEQEQAQRSSALKGRKR